MGCDSTEENTAGNELDTLVVLSNCGIFCLYGFLPIAAKPSLSKALNTPSKGAGCAWTQLSFQNNKNPEILGLEIVGTHEDY